MGFFIHKYMQWKCIWFCSVQVFSMAFGQKWSLMVNICHDWAQCVIFCVQIGIFQNPAHLCETCGAGYMYLHGSFGDTDGEKSGVSVHCFIFKIWIIGITLKHLCHHCCTSTSESHSSMVWRPWVLIQMWRQLCDSELSSCQHDYTHFFLHLFFLHVFSDCIVEGSNSLTQWNSGDRLLF